MLVGFLIVGCAGLYIIPFGGTALYRYGAFLSPLPTQNEWVVLASLIDVLTMRDKRVADCLFGVRGTRAELWQAVNDVLHKVEPIHLVQYDHVERCRGCALFLVTPHMDVLVVGPAIGKAVDEPWITMKRKHDRLVLGEERVEVVIAQAVRMFGRGLQLHEVDD